MSRSIRPTIAIILWALTGPQPAMAGSTTEQRIACTPDVFRLCKSEIPNVTRIVACMQREEANLSPACRAVFQSEAVLGAKPVVKAEVKKAE